MSDPSGMVRSMEEAMNDEFPEVRVEVDPKWRALVVHVGEQQIHLPGALGLSQAQSIFAVAMGLAHVKPCEYALRFLDSECSRWFAALYSADDATYKEVYEEHVIMRAEFAAKCRRLKIPSSNTPDIRALAKTVGDFEAANALLQAECTRFRLERDGNEKASPLH